MLEQFLPILTNTIIDNVILISAGLWLLIKGSDWFVQVVGIIARNLGISDLVIGLTLVAIGTSLPEFVSAIIASMQGQGALVFGNVVGANIANITLVVGGAAIFCTMPISKEMLERDGYMAFFSVILLSIFAYSGLISRLEGILFMLIFIAYTIFLIKTSQIYQSSYHIKEFAKFFFKFKYITETIKSVHMLLRTASSKSNESTTNDLNPTSFNWRNIIMLIISVGFIVLGGNLLVNEAVFFSGYFDLPVTLVGVVLALGTTAPEISVSIAAARKDMGGIVIGNAIGSILCNTFLILGLASTITPIAMSSLALYYALPFLLLVTLIMLFFKKTHLKISRLEGIVLCSLYIVFIIGYGILAS